MKINKNGTEKITDFMFAVGVAGYTRQQFQAYLEFEAYLSYRNGEDHNYVYFDLDFCQRSQWD